MRVPVWSLPLLSFLVALALLLGARNGDEVPSAQRLEVPQAKQSTLAAPTVPSSVTGRRAAPVAVDDSSGGESMSGAQIATAVAADPKFLAAIAERLDDPDPATQEEAAALLDELLDVAENDDALQPPPAR